MYVRIESVTLPHMLGPNLFFLGGEEIILWAFEKIGGNFQ